MIKSDQIGQVWSGLPLRARKPRRTHRYAMCKMGSTISKDRRSQTETTLATPLHWARSAQVPVHDLVRSSNLTRSDQLVSLGQNDQVLTKVSQPEQT